MHSGGSWWTGAKANERTAEAQTDEGDLIFIRVGATSLDPNDASALLAREPGTTTTIIPADKGETILLDSPE